MSQSDEEAKNKIKGALRTQVRARLGQMDEQQQQAGSSRACGRMTQLEAFVHSQVLMLYMPLANEVDLTPLALRCFQLGKTVCVPRVDSVRMGMTPVEVTTFDDRVMEVDEHGVRVPRGAAAISPASVDLVVVPGLAFDAHGHRLGRGAGYYDRFLARLRPGTIKIGLAFDTQIVDDVPMHEHDIPVDIVVSDRRVTYVQRIAQ